MRLLRELEFWTRARFPSDSDDAFLARSLVAAWTMDSASARPSASWGDIELFRHPDDVPRTNTTTEQSMSVVVETVSEEVEAIVPRRTTRARNPTALSAGGDYLMRAYTGEWLKITKTAKGFRVLPGTRLAEIIDRKEFLRGQAARWRMSASSSGDFQLSREVVFVSPPNFVKVYPV